MKKKSKRTKGLEEARPFDGLSKVNQNAAGVDIGATEIVACVSGGDDVQLVKAFGNYYYPDALSGHGGLAGNLRMVPRAWGQDGGHGEYGGVLDSAV